MDKIRVLVVDDSPFSQRMIKDALNNSKYEVCCFAGTGTEGIEKYRDCPPDVVTMDLTLPDMDGMECCREILTIDPHAKIVILSAMKDEAVINRGTALGVRGFLQKPVKSQVLIAALDGILTDKQHIEEQDAEEYKEELLAYFIKSFERNLVDMPRLSSQIAVEDAHGTTFVSRGLAIIIGITGSKQGRMILDLTREVAEKFTKKVLDAEDISEEDLFHCLAEFANIVAGHSVSQINNIFKDKDVELRLTAPSILLGESLGIINPKMVSNTVIAQTEIGPLYMNVGFVGRK